jgi:hypothetical protein
MHRHNCLFTYAAFTQHAAGSSADDEGKQSTGRDLGKSLEASSNLVELDLYSANYWLRFLAVYNKWLHLLHFAVFMRHLHEFLHAGMAMTTTTAFHIRDLFLFLMYFAETHFSPAGEQHVATALRALSKLEQLTLYGGIVLVYHFRTWLSRRLRSVCC